MLEKASTLMLAILMLPVLAFVGIIAWGLINDGIYLIGFGIIGICFSAALAASASALVTYGKKYSQATLELGKDYRSALLAKDFKLAGKAYQEGVRQTLQPGLPIFLNIAAVLSMILGTLAVFVGMS